MAGRRTTPPRPVSLVQVPGVADPDTQRALDALSSAVQDLQGARRRVTLEVDLVVGTNRIPHGLGRAVFGYTLTPSVASTAFAHALDRDNPAPEREVWIEVVGVDQPGARVEIF